MKISLHHKCALLTAIVTFVSLVPIDACTGIQIQTKDGVYVSGRTLEFGIFMDTSCMVVPRGYEFTGKTSMGPGMRWKTKYASVGVMIAGYEVILDGINEKGLTVGSFYFPGFAKYSVTTKENIKVSLSSSDFTQWMISQFATVAEVRKAIENNEVAISGIAQTPGFPSGVQPFHFIVSDTSGKSMVIEPVDGRLKLYDNPTGAMSNSPSFDWHLTNLRNYLGLSAESRPTLKLFKDLKISSLGQGNGMLGIPGDFTPPSRFVRAVAFSASAIPEKDAQSGIKQVFHILNNFDIPVGAARTTHDGVVHSDYTMFTSARDTKNLRYYYKTYEDQSIRMVDLNKFDLDAKKIKFITTDSEQPIIEVSNKLK
ncbi:MAG: choloylglycine hydrolase family protein [Verrucomicrobiota bacterium]